MEELAALYALGALPPDELRACEARLANPVFAAEVHSYAPVLEALSLSLPEVAPPAALRDRLLARIAAPASKSTAPPPVFVNQFVETRLHDIDWQELAPGLFAKELFHDASARTVTTLYRMDADTVVGSHTHVGVEQCFVLSGDFVVNGTRFGPGDFHCALPQSTHERITTTLGTTFLVVAPFEYTVSG